MYLDDVLYKGVKTSWGESMTISFGVDSGFPDEVDFCASTETIEVNFTVKVVNFDRFTEKLSLFLPFHKEFLLSLNNKNFESEKEIIFPEKNKSQKKVISNQIQKFVTRGDKNKFKDYLSLKTQGRDEFSSMRLKTLEKKMDEKSILGTKKENFDDKQRAVAYRWILRGLPLIMAIRKIKVDAEVARNSIYEKKKK
jgi:hypothetical protein